MTHHLGCGDDAGMGQCVSRSGPNNNNKPNILRRSCSWNSDVIENTTDEVGGVSQDDSVNLQAEATGRTSEMSVSPSPGVKELKMEHNDEYEDDFDEYEDEFEEDVDDTSDDEVDANDKLLMTSDQVNLPQCCRAVQIERGANILRLFPPFKTTKLSNVKKPRRYIQNLKKKLKRAKFHL